MKTLEYLAALVALAFFKAVPLSVGRRLCRMIAAVAWRVLRKPRQTCEHNLRLSFPEWDERKVAATAREVFRHLGLSLAEALKMSTFDRAWVEKNVKFSGMEEVTRRLKAGQGVIGLVSHFGSWELHGTAWALSGYPLAVVAFPQSNKRVDALILRNRVSTGMEIIYTGHRGTARALQCLRSGIVVGLLADQNAGKDGLRLPFFGRDCSVTKAPAVLARKTGAAILPSFLLREKDGTFTHHLLPEVPVDHTDDMEKDVENTTKRFLQVQEDFIRRHPEQYFWVHQRWKHYENR